MLWRNLGWQCLLVVLYRVLVGSRWLLWSVGFHKNIRTWNHGLNLLVSYLPYTKRMRNTPSANTKNHTTMYFGYWRTTQRLERCKHLEYLQKRRQTPTRKLQASITNTSHLQNTGTIVLVDRKLVSHEWMFPLIPYCSSLCRSLSCGTVSNDKLLHKLEQ
jgi:hypothetical protein